MRHLLSPAKPDLPPGCSAPTARPKGRGALGNPPVRFETLHREAEAADWPEEEVPRLATSLIRDRTRSVISWNESPDLGFDRAVNPYRGCEHGCIYCYARPTHAWLGYSPGLEFETRLVFKPEVASLLEKELAKPGYRAAPLVLGSNTDPYQPIERQLKLTRAVLEVLERCGHPVGIVTKSASILADLDILARLAARRLVRVDISLTTLDGDLARRMEPRAAAPARRLEAMRALARAGVPVGVLAAPMIPGLNDAELERILAAAAGAGAGWASYILLRLPHEVAELFRAWLEAEFPARAAHVLSLIRQTRAGALNESGFGARFRGTGPVADLLAQRFARAARAQGLAEGRVALDPGQFRPPVLTRAAAEGQLALL